MPIEPLSSSRLEAFSDGVIAVIITIMVLELRVPAREVGNLAGLHDVLPLVLVYLLSFIVVGIYWVNHHYLIDGLKQVTHGILWSNLAVLFCLSLVPVGTNWLGVRGISSFSVALYSAVCALPSIPWITLSSLICNHTGKAPVGGLLKQVISTLLYVGAIPLAYVSPYISLGMIGLVAIVWLLPPREIVELTRKSTPPNPHDLHSR
jgi:uncharacterized membrane protein